MSYSILQLKADLEGLLHGTTLNQITNIDGLVLRSARTLLLDIDPQETKRIAQLANPIYNAVYDYALPVDLKGQRIIDIRPQVNRQTNDVLSQKYSQDFDSQKLLVDSNNFNVNFNTGVKTIRINNPSLPSGALLNECDGITGNGTWAAGGDASNLRVDNVNYASGSGALDIDLGAAGTVGYIENSTMNAVDLTDELNQGSLFLFVKLPTASNFTSVTLRWGSDSSNYWTSTQTVTQQNTAFANGWNLIACPWASATTVGSPDVTAVDYLRVSFAYNGTAQTAVGIDSIVCRLGSSMEIVYYSKYLFATSTGTWQESVTDDSNLVNLDGESYNLLLDLVALNATQQQQGINALRYDAPYFQKKYEDDLARYRALYKSEVQLPQSVYYKKPYPNYAKWFGRRNWY
jgi:hypothetical protein